MSRRRERRREMERSARVAFFCFALMYGIAAVVIVLHFTGKAITP